MKHLMIMLANRIALLYFRNFEVSVFQWRQLPEATEEWIFNVKYATSNLTRGIT